MSLLFPLFCLCLLRIRYIKSAIKAPSIMTANIVTLISRLRRYARNVLLITLITRSPMIMANIKQTVTSNGLSHFRDAYRIVTPIMKGKRQPTMISNVFHIRLPRFHQILIYRTTQLRNALFHSFDFAVFSDAISSRFNSVQCSKITLSA